MLDEEREGGRACQKGENEQRKAGGGRCRMPIPSERQGRPKFRGLQQDLQQCWAKKDAFMYKRERILNLILTCIKYAIY